MGITNLLFDGSFDIIIHVQHFLDPVDILALRLTCKSLSEATQTPSVWMNAVRNVCISHGAYLPSFPLEEMSLDDLEHTALSPHRFRGLIEEYDGVRLPAPLLTRMFRPRTSGYASTETRINQMALIPGGRFLLTSTLSGNLFLWDLGVNAGSHMKLFPIATLVGGDSNVHDFAFDYQPTANFEGIYIVTKNTLGIDSTKLVSYEIYPNSASPTFHQIGTATIESSSTVECSVLSSDYYACYRGSCFVVWKFAAELGICWNLDDPPFKIYITGENVITFHNEYFLLWKLPNLEPLVNDRPLVVDHPANVIFGYPSGAHGINNSVTTPSPWLSQEAQKHFMIFNCNDGDSPMIHFVLKSIDTSHDALLPKVVPLRVGYVLGSLSSLHVDDLIVTDDGFLQTSRTSQFSEDSEEICADFISMPATKNLRYPFVSACLWSEEQSLGDLKDYAVCPMTGRVIVKLISKDDDSRRPKVHVMDFLLPRTFL